ncbi:DUF2235 domain-containing protein [Methylocella silvestris]|nr:DUF2235 domain-containing protein [Methylocella silvestris]
MGRLVSFLLSFFGVFAGFIAFAWWFNTLLIGLALRWAEWHPPLRKGPLWASGLLLATIWLLFTAISAGAAFVLFQALSGDIRLWLAQSTSESYVSLAYVIVAWAFGLMLVVGAAAGLSKSLGAWGAAKRRQHLFNRNEPELQDVSLPAAPGRGRRIVILCDGTSNRPDDKEEGESAATNVWKLSEALKSDDTQTVWYQPGVGTDTSSTAKAARRTQNMLSITGAAAVTKISAMGGAVIKLVESAAGVGISEAILNGYSEIVRQYQPGDRIYLIGFSRGSFAARCIAGVISRCGLLRADYLYYAPDVVQIYRSRAHPQDKIYLREDMAYPAAENAKPGETAGVVKVEFLGVFDTVASLGFPLWGYWFRVLPIWNNSNFSASPAKACKAVYHALSMDERRSQFFPMLFEEPSAASGDDPVLTQMWFRGAHGDIGGGYGRHEVSDVALEWMMDAMICHGLSFRKEAAAGLKPDPLGRLHDELKREPTWRMFGTWPRWHPVTGGTDGKLHASVLHRAETLRNETGRPDLLRLGIGESIEFIINMQSDWNRTGVVIEQGAAYRIDYLAGYSRDGACPPCGPDGQKAGYFDRRRWLGWGLRVKKAQWMALGATIAHPRDWPPRERPFHEALKFLFYSAPKELLDQIAMLGCDLHRPGDGVCLVNEAPGGLLHMFANDWWQTSSNNSGGPRLRVTRLAHPDEGAPIWTLEASGSAWSRRTAGGNRHVA